jgi:hypothetical protein
MAMHPNDADLPLQAKPPAYRSFLLRFWAERGGPPAVTTWRFSLEDPVTNRRHGFPNFESLAAWLQAEMVQAEIGDSQEADPAAG